MTRDKRYLSDYQSMPDGHVSFSDRGKGCVLGKIHFLVDALLKLKNVLHGEGLKANLMISINCVIKT